jgi:antitoxin YefM
MYIYLYISLNGPSHAMSHVSYTQLRANLASYLDEVCDTRTPLHVTRQNARTVVLMAEEEYEGMMETLHLLRNPANAARLLRSLERADTGELTEHGIAESPARAEP